MHVCVCVCARVSHSVCVCVCRPGGNHPLDAGAPRSPRQGRCPRGRALCAARACVCVGGWVRRCVCALECACARERARVCDGVYVCVRVVCGVWCVYVFVWCVRAHVCVQECWMGVGASYKAQNTRACGEVRAVSFHDDLQIHAHVGNLHAHTRTRANSADTEVLAHTHSARARTPLHTHTGSRAHSPDRHTHTGARTHGRIPKHKRAPAHAHRAERTYRACSVQMRRPQGRGRRGEARASWQQRRQRRRSVGVCTLVTDRD